MLRRQQACPYYASSASYATILAICNSVTYPRLPVKDPGKSAKTLDIRDCRAQLLLSAISVESCGTIQS